MPINLLLCTRRGAPWNPASSLDAPLEIHHCCQRRMQIEEMLPDLKQHLEWGQMRATTLPRRAMWLALPAIPYSFLYWPWRLA